MRPLRRSNSDETLAASIAVANACASVQSPKLVARGMSNPEVAAQIGRTEGAVKVHLKNILQKLDAHDRTAAVTIALQRGFIRLG